MFMDVSPIIVSVFFLNGFLHPRWRLARFLSFNALALTNPLVSHHETRPLEPCAEIATAEAAMADEDGGNEETPREAMEVSSSCFWTIKRYQKS